MKTYHHANPLRLKDRYPDLPVILILSACLLTSLAFWLNPAGGSGVGLTDFPLDDGWIHLVYSRAVATTLLPEYNPGQLETGMTSPLWVILNALLYWPGRITGLPPAMVPKLLSLIFGTIGVLLVYRLVQHRAGNPAAFATAFILSIDPSGASPGPREWR